MSFCSIKRFLFLAIIAVLVNQFFITQNAEFKVSFEENAALLASTGYEKRVLLGGQVVGFDFVSDGVLVLSNSGDGKNGLKCGDVLLTINEQKINDFDDISAILNEGNGQEIQVLVERDGKKQKVKIMPEFDILTQKYKLGVWVKDMVSGLGTVTYINPQNGFFGALGHPLPEASTGKVLKIKNGIVYNSTLLGVAKGLKGFPGSLKGVISRNKDIGTLSKNTNYGIYGTMDQEKLFADAKLVELGCRREVKPGKAQIYSTIDGEGVQAFDIQIIKTNYQNVSNSKSLVLKVTDKRLLEKTGGIVQGMSGSPIVQNGKLVGAVTHVFTNDPSKGFGIYIDWML